ncbi:MAG: hypothetical protein Q9219_000413 [cf. Caloplaca sp. 3 TL-2023]
MPLKKRRRKSGKPTPDQRTITQMDPFKHQLHPEEPNEMLQEDQTPVVKKDSSRKKRKTTPLASSVQTRSSKRREAKSSVKESRLKAVNVHEQQTTTLDGDSNTSLPESQPTEMPPPQTPKRVRRKVVPSSQSPVETPISTRSTKRGKERTITPLGERSINTPSKLRPLSRRKSGQRPPKLEVADSTNMGEEDGKLLFPAIVLNSAAEPKFKKSSPIQPHNPPRQLMNRSSPRFIRHVKDDVSVPPHLGSRREPSSTLMRRATIADSEEEEDNWLSRSPEKANTDRFQRCNPKNSAINNTNHIIKPDAPRLECSKNPINIPRQEATLPKTPFETIPTQRLRQQSSSPLSDLDTITTPSQSNFQHHPPASEKVPTQPQTELPQSSPPAQLQPPALETESQFQNAWREFAPSDPDWDDEPTLEPTLPNLPSPRNRPLSSTLPPPPVPPSQATTTDATQTTTTHQPRSDDGSDPQVLLSSSPPPQPQPHPYSRSREEQRQRLPLPHPPSSSPPDPTRLALPPTRTVDAGYQGWDGVRMTDSQLLPASLFDDGSLILPPFLRREEEDMELEFEEA